MPKIRVHIQEKMRLCTCISLYHIFVVCIPSDGIILLREKLWGKESVVSNKHLKKKSKIILSFQLQQFLWDSILFTRLNFGENFLTTQMN